MTDAAVIERARTLLGVRTPVALGELTRPRAAAVARRVGLSEVRAEYAGRDPYGVHTVRLRADVRGIARIYALAHECVHAAQAEYVRSGRTFGELYRAAGAYRSNPLEEQARRWGARVAAIIAAEMENA